MRITTQSAIDVSESLAGFLLGSYIHNIMGEDPLMEKRLKHVDTGKFSIADLYYPSKDTAIEMKSQAHGNSALKGVVQASMYKEQTDNSVFCMQRPNRRALVEGIESMCKHYGVGLIWINEVPNICNPEMIEKVTGGCSSPFYKWKSSSYGKTKRNLIQRSRSHLINEYIDTLEEIIIEHNDSIFEFKIKPDETKPGLRNIH